MSRVINKANPERQHVQPLRFSESPLSEDSIPFVVSIHEKYKERDGREETAPNGPLRGRSTSPIKQQSAQRETPYVPMPAPSARHSQPNPAAAKSESQQELERTLMETSREVTRLALKLEEAQRTMEGRVQEAFERGLSEGERLVREGQRQEAESYAYGLAKLGQLGRTLETQARHEALELALLVAKRIMQKEVEISPSFLVEIIKRTASQLLGRAEMTIRLHPEDLEVVRQLAPNFADNFPAVALVTMKSDDTLERGDCLIDTDVEQINLSLNEQLAALKRALAEDLA